MKTNGSPLIVAIPEGGTGRRWHAMSQPKDEDEDEGTTDQNPLFSAATK